VLLPASFPSRSACIKAIIQAYREDGHSQTAIEEAPGPEQLSAFPETSPSAYPALM
jgi:hypothetical protein